MIPFTDGGIAQAEARLDLVMACKQLTRRQRAALSLWLEGYTQEEIGDKQRRRVGHSAICRVLQRAIGRVEANLEGTYDDLFYTGS